MYICTFGEKKAKRIFLSWKVESSSSYGNVCFYKLLSKKVIKPAHPQHLNMNMNIFDIFNLSLICLKHFCESYSITIKEYTCFSEHDTVSRITLTVELPLLYMLLFNGGNCKV